jgi:predicted N-acyltransferase
MIKILNSIQDIDQEIQNFCNLPHALGSWNFYAALEKSKSLSLENGWSPKYTTFLDNNKIVGFIPLFLKTNSGDDFVYDQPLSSIFEAETNKKYFPKLQICIPFMPIEGSKFYFEKSETHLKNCLVELLDWSKEQSLSSLHITLPDSSESDLLEQFGFIFSKQSLCYWQNKSFASFADFLGTLKSKYRSQIQLERKTIASHGYTSFSVTSNDITPEHIDTFYDLFQTTHDRKGWIRNKLTKDFFHEFSKSNPENVVYIFIKDESGIVAASCHFLEKNLLCGRFWGSTTDDHFLHFEVMYYLPMEYCIQNKIQSMEIGFEKPHKIIRGFVPKQVQSFHYFFDAVFSNKAQSFFPNNPISDKNIFR